MYLAHGYPSLNLHLAMLKLKLKTRTLYIKNTVSGTCLESRLTLGLFFISSVSNIR